MMSEADAAIVREGLDEEAHDARAALSRLMIRIITLEDNGERCRRACDKAVDEIRALRVRVRELERT